MIKVDIEEVNNMYEIKRTRLCVNGRKEFVKWINERYGDETTVGIKDVIFNDPATIVIWDDNTKTVVKAQDEPFDKEKGLAMAIIKKITGNKGDYNEIFKEWCK